MLASCTSGYRCPGGDGANGNVDPTLCDGAPVYQRGGATGPVLFRSYDETRAGTQWVVAPTDRLANCNSYNAFLFSDVILGDFGSGPTAVGYNARGWYDYDAGGEYRPISVTLGGK